MAEGWYKPHPRCKSHYFRERKSLCGVHQCGPFTPLGNYPVDVSCTVCRRTLREEKEPQRKTNEGV